MDPINSQDPRPRSKPLDYVPLCISHGALHYLDVPKPPHQIDFWNIVQRRTSRRQFGNVDSVTLGALLWHSAKATRQIEQLSSSLSREHRPAPSAGGLHPICIIVQQCSLASPALGCYDPYGHALREIKASIEQRDGLLCHANTVLATQGGTILWLIGDFNKTSAIYTNAHSLVWRDTGALIGTLCLIAEAMNLNACPLGICGDEAIREVIHLPEGVHGVGAVVIGSRADCGMHAIPISFGCIND